MSTAQSARSTRGGYSDFFTSGFRSVVSRTNRRSSSPLPAGTSGTAPPPTKEKSQKPRPFSMLGPRRHSEGPSVEEKRQRRSSFIDFSPKFFDKMSRQATVPGKPTDKRRWMTHGRHNTLDNSAARNIPGVSPLSMGRTSVRIIHDTTDDELFDPFASSPDSNSFFIDLYDTPKPVVPSPHLKQPHSNSSKRESFLSLSGDSGSFTFPWRRPTSVHTMPLPSPRSSINLYRPPSEDKHEIAWALEDEEPLSSPALRAPMSMDSEDEWSDPAARLDWRQFHIDLLVTAE